MSDYISQEAAVTIADYAADKHPYDKDTKKPETYSEYNQGWNDACDYIRGKLDDEKPADVEPVRHGKWVEAGRGIDACSECNHGIREHMACVNKYCPNCGAKMDLGGNSSDS